MEGGSCRGSNPTSNRHHATSAATGATTKSAIATTTGDTATPTRSLDQGVIVGFSKHFYLVAMSLPWSDGLNVYIFVGRTTNQHPRTEGIQAPATSMLLFVENGYVNT